MERLPAETLQVQYPDHTFQPLETSLFSTILKVTFELHGVAEEFVCFYVT